MDTKWPLLAAIALWAATISTPSHADSGTRAIWDVVRWANPAVAALCHTMTGNKRGLWQLVTSVATSQTFIEWTKSAFGDHPLNDRPDGTSHGIISGHAAWAVSGFLSLSDCVDGIEWIDPVVANTVKILSGVAAGITIYSRVEANRHTALQSIGGAATAAFFHYHVAPEVNRVIEDNFRKVFPWSNADANFWLNHSEQVGWYVWARLNFSLSNDSSWDNWSFAGDYLWSNFYDTSWTHTLYSPSKDPWKDMR